MTAPHRLIVVSLAVVWISACTGDTATRDARSESQSVQTSRADSSPVSPPEDDTDDSANAVIDEVAQANTRLKQLLARIEAIEDGQDEEHLADKDSNETPESLEPVQRIATVLQDFSRTLSQKEYDASIQAALSDSGALYRFLVIDIAVERGGFDDAARVLTADLARNPENRSYRTWKWWEVNYGERADYKQLSRQLTDALLRRFRTGTAEERVAIADVFGQGPEAAKMGIDEFMEAIQYGESGDRD